jgi:hypothetical protein
MWLTPPARCAAQAPDKPSASPLGLPQHPDEHRSERPVLLAVDQELGEGPTLWVAPELSDPVGPVEVGEHEDVEASRGDPPSARLGELLSS